MAGLQTSGTSEAVSNLLRAQRAGLIRVCFETNGAPRAQQVLARQNKPKNQGVGKRVNYDAVGALFALVASDDRRRRLKLVAYHR